jgi:hypothetical protein
MLITMRRSGGFAAVPGLGRELSVETSSLPKGKAEELESAVHEAGIAELAQQQPAPPQAGDRFVYRLTVSEASTSYSVSVTEPFPSPAVGTLIDLLSSYA